MHFEEVATLEKLQALAGTDIEVLNCMLGARCKIISVDSDAPYGGIKVKWVEESPYSTHWSSPMTFRLQP